MILQRFSIKFLEERFPVKKCDDIKLFICYVPELGKKSAYKKINVTSYMQTSRNICTVSAPWKTYGRKAQSTWRIYGSVVWIASENVPHRIISRARKYRQSGRKKTGVNRRVHPRTTTTTIITRVESRQKKSIQRKKRRAIEAYKPLQFSHHVAAYDLRSDWPKLVSPLWHHVGTWALVKVHVFSRRRLRWGTYLFPLEFFFFFFCSILPLFASILGIMYCQRFDALEQGLLQTKGYGIKRESFSLSTNRHAPIHVKPGEKKRSFYGNTSTCVRFFFICSNFYVPSFVYPSETVIKMAGFAKLTHWWRVHNLPPFFLQSTPSPDSYCVIKKNSSS